MNKIKLFDELKTEITIICRYTKAIKLHVFQSYLLINWINYRNYFLIKIMHININLIN